MNHKSILVCSGILLTSALCAQIKTFNAVSDWLPAGNLSEANGILTVKGPGRIQAKEIIGIDPAKTYILKAKISSKSKTRANVYQGFFQFTGENVPQSIAEKHVLRVPGTDTALLEEVKCGDTVIKVKDASKWPVGKSFTLVFDADKEPPNFNIQSVTVVKAESVEGIWAVTFKEKIYMPLSVPRKLRLHSGSGFLYTDVKTVSPGEWIEMSGSVHGQLKDGFTRDKWSPGAVTFSPFFILASEKDDEIELKDVTLEVK